MIHIFTRTKHVASYGIKDELPIVPAGAFAMIHDVNSWRYYPTRRWLSQGKPVHSKNIPATIRTMLLIMGVES